MAKFTDITRGSFVLYEPDVLTENIWNGHLQAIQDGIQEHEHTLDGGQGATNGDANPIKATFVKMSNNGGSDLTAGTVVVIDTTMDNAFTTTTTQDDTKVCGVLAQDVASGAEGWVQVSGIADVNVDGSTTAIARGDLISTYTTAGVGGKAGTPAIGSILGKALQEASGTATIKVLLTLS